MARIVNGFRQQPTPPPLTDQQLLYRRVRLMMMAATVGTIGRGLDGDDVTPKKPIDFNRDDITFGRSDITFDDLED